MDADQEPTPSPQHQHQHQHQEQEQEPLVYTDEQRDHDLALLLDVMGAEPPAEMLDLAHRRDEEFAARRAHAA
ncbi:hypothetical protein GCM10017673_38090 [Streptosporangium violaceochromogenes]|nr:hypothetical protein GCM10017673_38090 [Streptosporangium violaceochromogenes]